MGLLTVILNHAVVPVSELPAPCPDGRLTTREAEGCAHRIGTQTRESEAAALKSEASKLLGTAGQAASLGATLTFAGHCCAHCSGADA